ncbi:MAG: hypothetical protein KC776_10150 [Myxococcales bacterium]|nr:hypothetical protein [Myxococcales bacterium]MCB9577734.1 hypothetical protein [Polyangiaceae bacterium]
MRKLIFTTTVAAAFLAASAATAEPRLGYKGDAALSADRMMGFTWSRAHREFGGQSETVNVTGATFMWRGRAQPTPFEAPRLSFDYFVIDSLNIGGTVGYASYGDDADSEHFLLAPRVGYMFGISQAWGFWLRGGLTYHSVNGPGNNGDEDGMALTAEGMFTVTPVDHFGFTFGPTFDMDITGSAGDADQTYRSFGINAGLVGWF